ncbi:hypothetical protein CEP51_010471 [Fusarium floridanum]|uniref:Heterokaryon incompatibility domain-containing protein n=1 Tax=Fusarium floridanum TaxID=1325733 RepID=A0A428RED5_9HYPO|nr:hypothetical protein CEP51_010471 [Fusarium floridanum]
MSYTNPHSCHHCDSIIVSRPDDNPELYEVGEPRQSLLLLRVLRTLMNKNSALKALEQTYLIEVDDAQIAQAVSDGCLFYKFISSGLKNLRERRRVAGTGSFLSDVAEEARSSDSQRVALLCIGIRLSDNAVKISALYRGNTRGEAVGCEILNRCVFGVFAEVRYTALSYCWGGEQGFRTTTQTIIRHQTRINFQDLPQTIKDAVVVTENLGLHHLWVDALCIVQDDERDKAFEIDRMGHVYENAEVTIAASRAERVQEGFLQDLTPYGRKKQDWVFKIHYRDLTGQISPIIIAPKYFRPRVDYLSKRAWAFQERLLSRRILEYSGACVHWTCQSHNDCDRRGGKCSVDELKKRTKISRGLLYHNEAVTVGTWHTLVDEFSNRSLTFPEDRLPAIGGIAERLGLQSKNQYLAGIWQSHLPGGLLWIVDTYAKGSPQPQASTYVAPSWSWASTNRPIKGHVFTHSGIPQVDILGVNVKAPEKGATYGMVISGSLILRGFVTPVDWKLPSETETYINGTISGIPSISIHRDGGEAGLLAGGRTTLRVYLLVIVSRGDIDLNVTGLILRQLPDRTYSRMGVFDVPYCPAHQKTYRYLARSLLNGNLEEVTIV